MNMAEMPAGYDLWKTQSGYEDRDTFPSYDDEPEEECCHEDYDRDILTGQATCNCCGRLFYLSNEQVAADMRREAEYDKWQRRQERREFWRNLTYPIRWPMFRLLEKVWPRKACSVLTDDEIPF